MKKKSIQPILCGTAALTLICLTAVPLAGCDAKSVDPPSTTAERTVEAMSTWITFQITGPQAESVCDEMETALYDFEHAASAYIPESEIARINQAAGQDAVEVTAQVYHIISRGIEAARNSDGLFDISIGPLTALWNVQSPEPRVPLSDDIAAALALVDYRDIVLSDVAGGRYMVALKQAGQRLDLGGIAKGYALDILREIMDRRGVERGLISIGGNVLVYKDKRGEPYTVGIRCPSPASSSYFCALKLADTIISTSGGYERFFVQEGVIYHHLFDLRTGYPVQNELLSVSVIHSDGLTADYLSTTLFVEGLEATLAWMQAGGQAVVVDKNNQVYISESLRSSVVQELCDTGNYTFSYV